jgi:peptide/nickel transport system substrate-binding protein
MKRSEFVRFLRNGLFFVLIAGLVLNLVGFQQQTLAATNIKVIRHSNSWPCHLDPAVGSDGTSTIALINMYDSLVFPNADGTIKPWLAKSWVVSKDSLTYTFTLRPGVKFHNGDELTAADVAFSLQRLMTIGQGYAFLFTGTVKEVKALNTYTVQITLKKSFGPFLGALVRLYILDEKQVMAHLAPGSYGEFKDYGMGWLVTNDAGSGPYQVNTMKTAESLLMEKFNGYWDGWSNKDAPQYAEEIGTTEPITVRTLLSRGALEISDQYETSENLAALQKLPNTGLATFYLGGVMSVMLNNKKAPTDDIHFRKALAYCVDYQQVINKIFPGSRSSSVVSRSTPGYDPNLKLYTLDLEKALAELKQSKYYGKLDQYPFELYWNASNPDQEKIALMIQANAATLGITVKVVKAPWLTITNIMTKLETTPTGTIISVPAPYAEAGGLLSVRYSSSSLGTWQQGEWLQSPEIDTLIKLSLATTDQTKRFQLYYAIQEKLVSLCPSIWLFENQVKQVYRSDYVVFPAAEAAKNGKPANPLLGYNFYYRDFKVFPENAKGPYQPFVSESTKNQSVMVLQIGKSTFTINGTSKTLDSPPVIKEDRTLVPIRAIVEALGGTVGWDGTARKATVTLGSTSLGLWIGKSTATVNGVNTPIDTANAKVVPEIINSRTMLPLRFVTENLGAMVGWDQSTQTITITFHS